MLVALLDDAIDGAQKTVASETLSGVAFDMPSGDTVEGTWDGEHCSPDEPPTNPANDGTEHAGIADVALWAKKEFDGLGNPQPTVGAGAGEATAASKHLENGSTRRGL